jgi:hypothetical protein
VTASNNGNPGTLSYQWYYNLTNSNTVSGATQVGTNSDSYTPVITTASTRYYFCVVTNTVANAETSTASTTSNTAAVTVLDETVFDALITSIENDFGVDAADIHYENYPGSYKVEVEVSPGVFEWQWQGGLGEDFHQAVLTAKAAVAAATTQAEVNDALTVLNIAFANLQQVHDVQNHTHDTSKGGAVNAITTFGGSDVVIEIKGDIRDVIGFKINSTDYFLTSKSGSGSSGIAWDIREGSLGGPVIGDITEGSAIVTLPYTLTDRLANGTHYIQVFFTEGPKNGNGLASLVVSRGGGNSGASPGAGEPISPSTGDPMNLMLWLILMIAALAVLFVGLVRMRSPLDPHPKRAFP